MQNVVKIFAFLALNNVGQRIYAKYYPERFSRRALAWKEESLSEHHAQIDFEKTIYSRLSKLDIDRLKDEHVQVINLGHFTILVTKLHKMQLFLISQCQENEILLEEVLICIYKCFKAYIEDSTVSSIYRAYPELAVIVDQAIDSGLPVTVNSEQILTSMRMRGQQRSTSEESSAGGMVSGFFDFAKKGLGF